jgi:hypothetical protein
MLCYKRGPICADGSGRKLIGDVAQQSSDVLREISVVSCKSDIHTVDSTREGRPGERNEENEIKRDRESQ